MARSSKIEFSSDEKRSIDPGLHWHVRRPQQLRSFVLYLHLHSPHLPLLSLSSHAFQGSIMLIIINNHYHDSFVYHFTNLACFPFPYCLGWTWSPNKLNSIKSKSPFPPLLMHYSISAFRFLVKYFFFIVKLLKLHSQFVKMLFIYLELCKIGFSIVEFAIFRYTTVINYCCKMKYK